MPWRSDQGYVEPGIKAASTILPRQPVRVSASALAVLPAGTAAHRPLGIVEATVPATEAGAVFGDDCVTKAVAGASLGFGAEVMVGSDNGALIPAAAAASGQVAHWAVGVSRDAAVAADLFSVYVKPRQI